MRKNFTYRPEAAETRIPYGKLDDLLHLRYRLSHLKRPDKKILAKLDQEIRRCDHSRANQSTNNAAPESSTKRPDSQRQLTLAL